jgi:hypothetical protein
MDRAIAEKAITIILKEIHARLDEAARIAKAAEACAMAGSIAEGVTVSMNIEQIMYEAGRLQDAASLLTDFLPNSLVFALNFIFASRA